MKAVAIFSFIFVLDVDFIFVLDVDFIFVLDVDFVTPLLSQLVYEGLIADTFGSKSGKFLK